MNDPIMSIFEEGGTDKSQPFYSTTNDTLYQLDLRWPAGYRVLLPYRHMHEVQYVPSKQGSVEEIRIHFPGFSALTVKGRNLVPLFEAFLEYKVQWMRQRSEDEDVSEAILCIEELQYFPLTDWECDFWANEQRRAEFTKTT